MGGFPVLGRLTVFLVAFVAAYRSPSGGVLTSVGALVWAALSAGNKAAQQERSCAGMRSEAERNNIALQIELAAVRSLYERISPDLTRAGHHIAELEHELTAARLHADKIRDELALARGSGGIPRRSEREKLYAKLGILPAFPNAFLPHLRRAIILSLHPDKQPEWRKVAAGKRFVQAMDVLEKIIAERG